MVSSLLLLCGCNKSNVKHVTDGTYTGTAEGYGGTITTEVTFENGAITNIEVINHHETDTWSDAAILNMPAYITNEQSLNVDVQTGATQTCEGIKASVLDAIQQAGSNEDEWNEDKTDKRDVTHISRNADVVIIGGGISGITATLRLQQLGIDCVLVEKGETLGGSLKYGGHYTQIVCDEEDEENESMNEIINDIVGKDNELNSKEKILQDNLIDTVSWQKSDLGIAFSKDYISTSSFSGNAIKQYATSNSNVGELLSKEADVSGADILLKTCAISFEKENGKVTGIQAINTEGNIYHIVADYIIIASGSGSMEGVLYAGDDENTSDLYEIANKENLSIHEIDNYEDSKLVYQIDDTKAVDSYDAIGSCIKDGMILVNSNSERFVNEESSKEDISQAINDDEVYLVMNNDAYTKWKRKISESLTNKEKELLEENSYQYVGTSLQEVSEMSGIDYDSLFKTVTDYNDTIENAGVDILGRINTNEIIDPEESVYVVKLTTAALSNNKIITTDENLNAVDTEGNSIENIYVIGSACGNVFSDKTVEGGMNAWAFVSGKYVADKIASQYE